MQNIFLNPRNILKTYTFSAEILCYEKSKTLYPFGYGKTNEQWKPQLLLRMKSNT